MTFDVSNSEITTWKACRRKWWLTYYLRLRPRKKELVGPLALGSRIHSALETYYRDGVPLLEAHSRLLDEDRGKMIEGGFDEEKLDSEAELGRLMLEGYLDWVADEGLDADLKLLGVEELLHYDFPLRDGDFIRLIGKIDQRVLKEFSGTRSVLDFKSAINFGIWNDIAHMSPQMKTYQLLDKLSAERDGVDTRIDGAIIRMLRKVKRGPRAQPPFYEDMYISHNEFTLRAFWTQLSGVLQEIHDARSALDNGGDPMQIAHPNPTANCRWSCNFFGVCSMFDDGSNVDSALDDQFAVGDPYDYYKDIDDSDNK